MVDTITRARPTATHRAATIAPASFRDSDLSVDVIWTTGAPVRRFGIFSDGYIETLEVTPAALRLDRMNAGAAVLDSHDQYRLAALIGSVIPGSTRIVNGEGTCRIRLADTADVADIVAKVRDGHLRSISVGYIVHTYERHPSDDGPDELRAIDWEPVEISLVSVPADPGAHLRARKPDMTNIIDAGAPRPTRQPTAITNRAGIGTTAPTADAGPNGDDGTGEQRQSPRSERGVTIARIRELCGRTEDLSRAFERELIEDHADTPLTERQVSQRISEELIAVRTMPSVDVRAPRAAERGSPGQLHERMADALFARLSGTAPTEQAREFVGASMVDMARGIMEARGERVRWATASAVVDQMSRSGSNTTADFPAIMANATQRYLGQLITADPSPLRAIARQRTANDFRRMAILQLSGAPALLVVKENGEIKSGTAVEASEGYALATYARIFAISRQAIINDDLGAFARIFEGWARAANDLEANILKSQIEGNGLAMADGKPLYHADHANLAGATAGAPAGVGTPITVASLTAGRIAMRTQKDVDGVSPINVVPKYLVVGAAQETAAEQVLAQLAAATPAGVNPFAGKLELIVDGRLTGYSWRLFADPAQWTVIEEARLAGQEDVFVDTKVGFEVDGISVKARLDIAAAAIDWRGTYLNPGAAPA